MIYGTNMLTVWGPFQDLYRLSQTGFHAVPHDDISGWVYISTWEVMYFGQYINVLGHTENSITISYRGYEGTFVPYLEALARRYKKCFFKNQYTDQRKTEIWMARTKNGKVHRVSVEPITKGITDFELVE